MSWNFKNFIKEKLTLIIRGNVKYSGMSVEVSNEQAFTKMKDYTPNTIYVVIKELSSSFEYNTKTTPIQLLVISEENSLDKTKEILDTFASTWNWNSNYYGTTYVKQQYNSPVVLSNFGDIASGYRSILYVSGTLYIMEGVLDVKSVKIGVNGGTKESVDPLNFSLIYGMAGNTQQVGGEAIASTVKSTATLSLALTIPFLDKTFMTSIYGVMLGTTSGNTTFNIEFVKGNDTTATVVNMKLNSATITTAPNQVAGLQLGFIK